MKIIKYIENIKRNRKELNNQKMKKKNKTEKHKYK